MPAMNFNGNSQFNSFPLESALFVHHLIECFSPNKEILLLFIAEIILIFTKKFEPRRKIEHH